MSAAKIQAVAAHLQRLNGLLMEAEPLVNQHLTAPKPATAKQIRVIYTKIEAEARRGKQLF